MTPGRLAGSYAVLAGSLAFVLAGVNALSTILGALGLLVLAVGCYRRSRGGVMVGCAGLFSALLVGGVSGLGRASLLGAGGGILVAWTVGGTAAELGNALGASARSWRLELTHAAGSSALAIGAAGLALLPGYLTVSPSPVGVALLVLGGIALTAALALDRPPE